MEGTESPQSSSGLKNERLIVYCEPYTIRELNEQGQWISKETDVVEAFLTDPKFPSYGGLKVVGATYADGWSCLGFCFGQREHALFLSSVTYRLRKARGIDLPLVERTDYGGGEVNRGKTSVGNRSDSLDDRPLPPSLGEAVEQYLKERAAAISK